MLMVLFFSKFTRRCNAGDLLFAFKGLRPLRTNWLIVGILEMTLSILGDTRLLGFPRRRPVNKLFPHKKLTRVSSRGFVIWYCNEAYIA